MVKHRVPKKVIVNKRKYTVTQEQRMIGELNIPTFGYGLYDTGTFIGFAAHYTDGWQAIKVHWGKIGDANRGSDYSVLPAYYRTLRESLAAIVNYTRYK